MGGSSVVVVVDKGNKTKKCSSSSWCDIYTCISVMMIFFHLIASIVVAHGWGGRVRYTCCSSFSGLLHSLYQLTNSMCLFLASETVFSIFPLLCTFASLLNKRLKSLVVGNTKHREREREKRESLFHLFHIQV